MFFVALLLSPLIGFMIELIRDPSLEIIEARAFDSGKMRKCPDCAELVRAEAVKYRFCGAELPELEKPESHKDNPWAPRP